MKALTLHQPYASAIALRLKRYETRSWATKYRGPLAIHAASKKRWSQFTIDEQAMGRLPEDLPFGCVIAIVELVDVVAITDILIESIKLRERNYGDWRVGRFAWRFDKLRVLSTPVVTRGYQGLWVWRPTPEALLYVNG